MFKKHFEYQANANQVIECVPKNNFSYFPTKTYVVGTQKNCLKETLFLSTQNIW